MGTGVVVTANNVGSEVFHPKTKKEIEEFGPEEVHRRRIVMARVARRNDSPLAEGLGKEAKLIAQTYNLGPT